MTIVVITIIIIAYCLGWEDFVLLQVCRGNKLVEREREERVDERRRTADGPKAFSDSRKRYTQHFPRAKTTEQTKRDKKKNRKTKKKSVQVFGENLVSGFFPFGGSSVSGKSNSGRLRADEGYNTTQTKKDNFFLLLLLLLQMKHSNRISSPKELAWRRQTKNKRRTSVNERLKRGRKMNSK